MLSDGTMPVPVEWAYRRLGDGGLTPRHPGLFAVRSQDLETSYYDAGCFVYFPVSRVLREGPGDDTEFVGYLLPKWKAVDIDDPEDWDMAERLYRSGLP